ncbi:hypothetical protein HDU98_009832 [Podochytrium sp. JEL0797]|nr:hypothetical protein HDU98_009832 [Podochytrium sp. JEL0797]
MTLIFGEPVAITAAAVAVVAPTITNTTTPDSKLSIFPTPTNTTETEQEITLQSHVHALDLHQFVGSSLAEIKKVRRELPKRTAFQRFLFGDGSWSSDEGEEGGEKKVKEVEEVASGGGAVAEESRPDPLADEAAPDSPSSSATLTEGDENEGSDAAKGQDAEGQPEVPVELAVPSRVSPQLFKPTRTRTVAQLMQTSPVARVVMGAVFGLKVVNV